MTKQLPERANLEHLKSQAKALLSSLSASSRLADAQRELAREYGFASWTRLKRYVESRENRQAAFFLAIRGGDRREVERLLGEDPSLVGAHDPNSFEAVPLTLAAERDDRPMIDLLLANGADIDARSTWWAGGFSALDLCADETAEFLLDRGATLTPHVAARLGKAVELKAMLDRNPEAVCQRGGDGQYPLHFAKTPEIVDILVDAGADLDARDLDHVSTAAQWRIQDANVLRRLLDRGATADIFMAVMLDDAVLVKQLVEADPNNLVGIHDNEMIPPAPGGCIYTYNIGLQLPFQAAIAFGKTRALEQLRALSSPKLRLMMSIWEEDRESALSMSHLVKELSPEEQAILPQAAWERQIGRVRLMLELGFDVDATGVHHSSALDRAAFHGFDDVIELVLGYGPSLTIRNEFGGTPFGACLYGSTNSWRKDGNFPRCVQLLVAAGAEIPEQVHASPEVLEVLESLR
jgi:ankyrin repeat protein